MPDLESAFRVALYAAWDGPKSQLPAFHRSSISLRSATAQSAASSLPLLSQAYMLVPYVTVSGLALMFPAAYKALILSRIPRATSAAPFLKFWSRHVITVL